MSEVKDITGVLELCNASTYYTQIVCAGMATYEGCKVFKWNPDIYESVHNDVDLFVEEIKHAMTQLVGLKWKAIEKGMKAQFGVSIYQGIYDAIEKFPEIEPANKVLFMFKANYGNEPYALRLLCAYPSPKIQCLSTSGLALFASP